MAGHGAASKKAPDFFRVVDLAVDEIDRHHELFDRIHRGEVQGARIRGAFPAPRLAEIVARIERGDLGIESADAQEGAPVQIYGRTLQWAGGDLAGYFAAAARFRERCAALFQELDFERRVAALLAPIAAGRRVALPRGPSGESYAPASIRRISRGGRIPPHFENHQVAFPGYRHLRDLIQADAIASCLVTLAPADEGGRLVVHAMTLDDFARSAEAARGGAFLERALGPFARQEIAIDAGDLLLFDSGRFAHEVTTVLGARARWTIGGVLAPSRAGDELLYWH